MKLNVGDRCAASLNGNIYVGRIVAFQSNNCIYRIKVEYEIVLDSMFKSISGVGYNYSVKNAHLERYGFFVYSADVIDDKNLLKLISYSEIGDYFCVSGIVDAMRIYPNKVYNYFDAFIEREINPLIMGMARYNDKFTVNYSNELITAFRSIVQEYAENKSFYKGGYRDGIPF